MKLIISENSAHALSLLGSCAFIAAIYVKNWFLDSPIHSKFYALRRELNPEFDFSNHPVEI